MDLIARLHHLLLEVEEDLREARLFLGQGEYSLVDHFESQGWLHTFAAAIGHAEADAGLAAGFVDRRIQCGFDPQFVGGLYEYQAMIAHGLPIAAEDIGVEFHSPRHARCGR